MNALYASKMISYAQGFMLMRQAAQDYRVEAQLWCRGDDVARRMYYPQQVLREDQGSLCEESRH